MLCLVIEFEGRHARHALGAGDFTVGSAADNHLVLASEFVSRHHALIRVGDEGVEVRDLGSRNGTVVNGTRIDAARVTPPAILHFAPDVVARIVEADSDELLLFPGVAMSSQPGSPGPAAPRSQATQPGRQAQPLEPARRAPDARRLLEALSDAPADAPWPALLAAALDMLDRRRGAIVLIDATPSDHPVVLAIQEPGGETGPPIEALRIAARSERVAGSLPDATRDEPGSFAAAAMHSRRVMFWADGGAADRASLEQVADALRIAARLDSTTADAHAGIRSPRRPFRLMFPDRSIVEGESRAVRELHRRLAGAAASDLNVLLIGPTGVGKEIYANSIHAQSARSAKPFRAVNSSAMPESLFEALLFGTEEGVATGVRRQRGLLRECEGGTFFLDEIGDLREGLQAKLLRVLDSRTVLPVGGLAPVPVSVRFIAATNRDLRADIRQGRFREDLYQRLRGHEFRLPALAERVEDIPLLANAFLRDEARKARRTISGMTVKAMQCLMEHSWPGNIRELETTMRRLVHEIPGDGQPIGHEDLPPEISGMAPARHATLEARLDLLRRRIVSETLGACAGNRTEAARRLGIGRVRLRALMQRLGIEAGDDHDE